ncbi:MAG TPA: ATP-binding cassette domain-containing protein [Conexibacter sp.]|jgi:ABC-type lipoprotein export system ATPase subunit|nr:ATP-binding cassette domain-containing protein [Conexibacter sp.]
MSVLAFDRVTRRRRVGRERVAVLDAACFEAWPGELVAILGPHRSGKTTVLRIAAGVEVPDAGSVRLDGEPLGELKPTVRTRRLRAVGFAPKAWRVARGKPVLDHVALPLLAEGRPLMTALAKAHETIERVGAAHCAGATADELAPGDETRVALAQALVREPRLLLVDEPGALAPPDERDELLRLLRAIVAERPQLALVVTARDVAGVAGAGRVLTLGDGALRGAREPASAEVVPFPGHGAEAIPIR